MVFVNDDWQTAGVRSVNRGPQPGSAEAELPATHPAVLAHTGGVSPAVAADRDMNSDLAQVIFTELGTSQADKARVRAALVSHHQGQGASQSIIGNRKKA